MQEKRSKTLGRKIRDIYCYTDFYLNRGLGIVNTPIQIIKNTAYVGIVVLFLNEALKDFNWWIIHIKVHISPEWVVIFTPPFILFLIVFGILDVRVIKMLQKTNEISTKYNPVFSRMDRQIRKMYGKQEGEISKQESDEYNF